MLSRGFVVFEIVKFLILINVRFTHYTKKAVFVIDFVESSISVGIRNCRH